MLMKECKISVIGCLIYPAYCFKLDVCTYNSDIFALVIDSTFNIFDPHIFIITSPMFAVWEGQYFMLPCTLNCASNWPADIPWQAGEDTNLLNTWHCAALSKCKIKCVFVRKRKQQSENQLSRTGLEGRWMMSRNACIPSFSAPTSLYLQ